MSDFVIIAPPAVSSGNPSLEMRGIGETLSRKIATNIEDQLERLADNVAAVIAAVGDKVSGYGLDTVEVEVAVDAKGEFGIASAGVNASFKLVFGRRDKGV